MAPSVLHVHMSRLERAGLKALAEHQEISEEWVLRRLLRAALPADWNYQDKKPKQREYRYLGLTGKWEETKVYAVARVAEYGYVTATDLVRDVGMSTNTASKYVDLLISQFGWTSEPANRPPRGKVAGPKV